MDVVVDKRGVMYILVHIGNQRIVNEGVDISRVVDIVVDISCIIEVVVNKGCVVYYDCVKNKNGVWYRVVYGKVGY